MISKVQYTAPCASTSMNSFGSIPLDDTNFIPNFRAALLDQILLFWIVPSPKEASIAPITIFTASFILVPFPASVPKK